MASFGRITGIKRVMVTGASGKLGGPLCEALLGEEYEVLGVDYRLPTGIDGIEEVEADVGDREAIEELVSRSDAVIHLASCKEDRDAFIDISARGTFNILDAAMRTKKPKRVILASGDCVNGIYFYDNPEPVNERMPLRAYPGYYALSKVVEETMFTQYYIQAGVPTVINRMSWIQAEDDILSHLTVAGEGFGVPVWSELMDDAQRLDIDVLDLIDPVGKDFCIDVTKARYQLGYQPNHDIFSLIDKAIEFRKSGRQRRLRSGIKG